MGGARRSAARALLEHRSFFLSPAFATGNLKGYFDTFPGELDEATMLDGAFRWGTSTRIIPPLARPAFVVTGLFAFMGAWDEFVLAANFRGSERASTLPVVFNG